MRGNIILANPKLPREYQPDLHDGVSRLLMLQRSRTHAKSIKREQFSRWGAVVNEANEYLAFKPETKAERAEEEHMT